jgi:PKD repeat protein
MKKATLFLVALCSSLITSAQWTNMPLGTTANMTCASYYSPTTLWLGGSNRIMKSTNGGVSFTVISPMLNGSGVSLGATLLSDIEHTSSTTALSVGYFNSNTQYIMRTTNGGSNWVTVWSSTTGVTPRTLLALDHYGSKAIAVGNNGNIRLSLDTGLTWASVTSGVSSKLNDVQFYNADTIFACGQDKILRSINGGTTWTQVQPFASTFTSISISNGIVYVNGGNLLKSTNFGATWTTDPLYYGTARIQAFSSDTVVMSGPKSIIQSNTGGGNWMKYILPYTPATNTEGLDFLNSQTGVFLGGYSWGMKTFNLSTAPVVPVANFYINTGPAYCEGATLPVINYSTPGYVYEWYLNGVLVSTNYTPTITAGSGSFFQPLKLITRNGSYSDSMTINVGIHNHLIDPYVVNVVEDSICAGNTVKFKVPVTQNGISYQLRKGYVNVGAPIAATGAAIEFSASVTSSGNYNVKATKTTTCFTDTSVVFKPIYVIPSPGGPAAACIPSTASMTGNALTNVTFGSINHSLLNESSNYLDYSCCISTSFIHDSVYPISISSQNWLNLNVWIDWNNDGTFGAGEFVFSGTGTTVTGNITVPPTMLFNQKLRMRVATATGATTNPCTSSYNGQAKDYSVILLPNPSPVASFTYTTTAACNTIVNFTNTSTDATAYSWDFGDGSPTVTTQNTSHTYSSSGIYNVSLVATQGATADTSIVPVTINNPLVPVPATCNPTLSGCSGRPLFSTFDTAGAPYNSISGPVTDWVCTKQFICEKDVQIDFVVSTNGQTNNFSAFLDTNQDGQFDPSENVISGGSWLGNVGVSGYAPLAFIKFPASAPTGIPLRFRIMMNTGYSSTGCFLTCGDYKDFTVFLLPSNISAAFAASDTVHCSGAATVSFSNTSTGANTYLWNFGDGDTSTLAAPTHVYSTAGNYSVTLTACNSGLCDTLTMNNYIFVDGDCVWPGDVNSDNIVDGDDFLGVAINYGNTGAARESTSNLWQEWPGAQWMVTSSFAPVDQSHSDCNGDGTVNTTDTIAISSNWALTHAPLAQVALASTVGELYLSSPSLIYNTGDWATIDINLGTTSSPLPNIYGLHFQLNFDNTVVVPGTVSFDYNDSWLTDMGANKMTMVKYDGSSGMIWSGVSRIDHTDMLNGAGKIGTITLQYEPGLTNIAYSPLYFGSISAIDANGVEVLLGADSSYVAEVHPITTGITNTASTGGTMSIGPNPVKDEAILSYTLQAASDVSITMYDVLGHKIYSSHVKGAAAGKHSLQLPCAELKNGIYFIRLSANGQEQVQKMVLSK